MKQHQNAYPVRLMARLLKVSVSGFYDWLDHAINPRTVRPNQQRIWVKVAHQEMKESYGTIRLSKYLQSQGIDISQYAIRRIKQVHHLYCKRHKRYKQTTNSHDKKPVYDNLLQQDFKMSYPNQAWVTDITYIWTTEGWLYLAAFKDLYSKKIVGYSLNERMTAQLVCDALSMAIHNQKPSKGLIVHSDRGGQYCSHDYRNMLKKHEFQGSMSKRGDCYDNAPIESFSGEEHCSASKNELVHHHNYQTRQQAKEDIIKYIRPLAKVGIIPI